MVGVRLEYAYTKKIWRVQEDVTVDRRADPRWI
jgi:hypothetical protein